MSDASAALNEIHRSEDADEVIKWLDRSAEFGPHDRWRIVAAALYGLRDLGYPGFGDIASRCSIEMTGIEGRTARSALSGWVRNQPETTKLSTIRNLVEELVPTNATDRINAAIWTIISVGYRTPEAIRSLLSIAAQSQAKSVSQDVRDAAVWAIAQLGDGRKLLRQLATSLADRDQLTISLLTTAGYIGSASLLPVVSTLWGRHSQDSAYNQDILRAFAGIADANRKWAVWIWDAIIANDSEEIRAIMRFAGDISQKFDCEDVPSYFIRQLEPQNPTSYDAEGVEPHWHIYLRLQELTGPRQLRGLRSALPLTENAIEALKRDACIDTQNKSYGQTKLTYLKLAAWDTILRLGLSNVKVWLPDAMCDTSPFTSGDLCQLAGFLRLQEALPQLTTWVKAVDTQRQLALSAVRALGLIGSPSAFGAICESRFFDGQHVPQDVADAMANCCLTMGGADGLIELLAKPQRYKHLWIAAAAGLEEVAVRNISLVKPLRESLFSLLHNEDLRQREGFGYVVSSVGFLDRQQQVIPTLRRWAESEPQSEHGIRASEVLARWGNLQDYPHLIEAIGLRNNKDGQWTRARELSSQEAFVLGILYLGTPAMFGPAVAQVIQHERYDVAFQVLRQLGTVASSDTPSEVVEALVSRAAEGNTRYHTETSTLYLLSRLAPERFIHQFSADGNQRLTESTRAAIVECLCEIGRTTTHLELVEERLATSIRDKAWSVRRLASRSLGKVAPDRLLIEVRRLLGSDLSEERTFGVEATTWIRDHSTRMKFLKQGQRDPEASVRQVASRCEADSRVGEQRASVLKEVLHVADEDLLSVWHLARALVELGDDHTLGQLREGARKPAFGANKRAWLSWIAKDLERQWKSKSRKWTEVAD